MYITAFKIEGKIKMSPDKQTQWEFIARRPVLQEILMEARQGREEWAQMEIWIYTKERRVAGRVDTGVHTKICCFKMSL